VTLVGRGRSQAACCHMSRGPLLFRGGGICACRFRCNSTRLEGGIASIVSSTLQVRSSRVDYKCSLAAGQWLQILPLLPYYLAFLNWKIWDTQLLLCGNECFKSEFQVTQKRYPNLRRICTSSCRQKQTQIDPN
jgi:hypothetical protein